MAETKKTDASKKGAIATALISGLIIAICASALTLFLMPSWEQNAQDTQHEMQAQVRAQAISSTLKQLNNNLRSVANTSNLHQGLSEADKTSLQAMSVRLTPRISNANSALLIPANRYGSTQLLALGLELRNNIEKNLVNQTARGEEALPQAYLYQNQAEFSIATAVRSPRSNRVVAVLLARYSGDTLKDDLESADQNGDTSSITQITAQNQLVLSTTSTTQQTANGSTLIPNSNWNAQYIAGTTTLAKSIFPLPLALLLAFLPVLIVPLWQILALRKRENLLQHDIKTLAEYINKLGKGDSRMPPALNDLRLKPLVNATGSLRSKSPKTTKNADESALSPTASKAAQEPGRETSKNKPKPAPKVEMAEHIFRAYDIRGIADQELSNQTVKALGLAIGSEASARGHTQIALACDGRLSSPRIKAAIVAGLKASGQQIIDIGCAPTPLLYFATHELNTNAGIMITGSHNNAEYNGLKLVLEGKPLAGEHIQNIKQRIVDGNYTTGEGSISEDNVNLTYIEKIITDIAIAAPLKIAMDAGNGMAGDLGPRLFEELGCEVIALHCEIDGNFPNHAPDPTRKENLADLSQCVLKSQADIGLAFDGDADRLIVLDSNGEMVEPDALLMLLAQDVVSRNPGADIIYDVKCTRHLGNLISSLGGRPIMWKSGHSFIKEKMLETGALLGGEYTGHICFKERWYGFDDGLYAAARLIEIVSMSGLSLNELLAEFPSSVCTPEIIIETGEKQKFNFVSMLSELGDFGDGKVSKLDGLRVDFKNGWGLVRASNTGPAITMRFEADDDAAIQKIQGLFREQIGLINPALAEEF